MKIAKSIVLSRDRLIQILRASGVGELPDNAKITLRRSPRGKTPDRDAPFLDVSWTTTVSQTSSEGASKELPAPAGKSLTARPPTPKTK